MAVKDSKAIETILSVSYPPLHCPRDRSSAAIVTISREGVGCGISIAQP
jgi:hypothetical protein